MTKTTELHTMDQPPFSAAATLRSYYYLTKPGIIRGNVLTATAGFLLAAQGHPALPVYLAMFAGIMLVIASACVSNNILDRRIDSRMARTRRRALVSGDITVKPALIYAGILGLSGVLILAAFVNLLTAILGILAYVMYVAAYGLAKRRTEYGTLVGTVSGALPPVGGYVAVTGRLDAAAGLLFLILVLWQMPHFFSIAIFRKQDYAAAGIPVLPVVRGVPTAKRQIVAYIAAFIPATALLTVFGYTGYVYLAAALVLGLIWLRVGIKGLTAGGSQPSDLQDDRWAKQVFGTSIIVLTLLSLAIGIDSFLPR